MYSYSKINMIQKKYDISIYYQNVLIADVSLLTWNGNISSTGKLYY